MALTYADRVAVMPELFRAMMSCERYKMQATKDWSRKKAVYAFFEGDVARHVGRTRNLEQRIRGHLANSHYSASFAFSQARTELGIKPSYRKGEGRPALLLRADFRDAFDRQRSRLRSMELRFVAIVDPLTQYLFELYAAMELQTPLGEFETS